MVGGASNVSTRAAALPALRWQAQVRSRGGAYQQNRGLQENPFSASDGRYQA